MKTTEVLKDLITDLKSKSSGSDSPFLKLKHPFSSHSLQASHVLSPYLANAYSSLKTPLRKPSPNALPCPTRGL